MNEEKEMTTPTRESRKAKRKRLREERRREKELLEQQQNAETPVQNEMPSEPVTQEETSVQNTMSLKPVSQEETPSIEPIATIEKGEEPKKEEQTTTSHTQLLDDLVKEVQIFSDDEDFAPMKKGRTWIWILILILLAGVGAFTYYYFFYQKEEKKPSQEEETKEEVNPSTEYHYEPGEGEIIFYQGDEEIDRYSCSSKKCSVYSVGRYEYHKDSIIALQDGDDIFLYDFVKQKRITNSYLTLKNLLKDGETVAFIAQDEEGMVGIINVEGEEMIPFQYDELGYSFGGGEVSDYSYEKDLITASKDGKWGLISLSNGKELIPFQYEDMYYSGYDAIAVLEDSSWKLFDLEGKPYFKDTYDMIVPLKSYILVAKDQEFNILNYEGEKQLHDKIPAPVKGFRGRQNVEVPTFKYEIDGTIIVIQIMESEEDLENYSTYRFNTVNGEFTKVIS